MEGLPIVLMEALASRLPVVATRLSGIPEIVVDGVTGALAEPADVHSLRATLECVLADPDQAARWADAGRVKVEAEFDIRDVTARLRELFATSAAGGSPRRARRPAVSPAPASPRPETG
jgi:glycosyltransferase involved in cell wall biosynthesis